MGKEKTMRVLLIETQISGHHISYMKGLLDAFDDQDEYHVVLPQKSDELDIDDYRLSIVPFDHSKIGGYLNWVNAIISIIDDVKPDAVHFVYGDDLYRYFGLKMKKVAKLSKVYVTYHHVRRSKLRDISLRRISHCSSNVVVHTNSLYHDLRGIDIRNVLQIDYPQFSKAHVIDKEEARRILGIREVKGKVLLSLGGTREDKGLDVLLKALRKVEEPFHLIIAGREEFFTRDFIEREIVCYRNQVSVFLEFLSEEKMAACLNAADCIVLPYKKAFDGASGPLGEGVWLQKEIIGPAHGSLGQIIRDNHLGITFESEDPDDLTQKLHVVLRQAEWNPDKEYGIYRKKLDPVIFSKKYRRLYMGDE